MIGLGDVYYQANKLYCRGADTGYSVVRFPEEDGLSGLWKVSWPDGVLSKDYYNKTRTKDHAIRVYANSQNTVSEEAA